MRRSVLALFLFLSVVPCRAFGNPVDMFFAGGRSGAMGGAQCAEANDYASVYANPATMPRSEAGGFSLGLGSGFPSLSINGNDFETPKAPATTLGVISSFGGLLKDAYFGMYIYMPTNSTTTIITRSPTEPQFIRYQGLHRFAIYPGLAYRLHPMFSLGVALSLLTDAEGELSFEVDLANQAIPKRDFYLKMRPHAAGIIGLLVTPLEGVRLGLSYRGEHQLNINMPASFDLGVLALYTQIQSIAFFTPAQIQFGSSVNIYKPLTVTADVIYSFWSRTPNLASYVQINSSVLFPPLPGEIYEPGFKDTASLHLGAEYQVFSWLMPRAGFAYIPTPVPDQVGASNYLDNTRLVFTTGVGVAWDNPVWTPAKKTLFDFTFQYHLLEDRLAEKTNPLDAVGDLKFGGSMVYLGLMVTTKF